MVSSALSETCGGIHARPECAVYVGPALDLDAVSSSVGYLAVALDEPFLLRSAEHGTVRARSAWMPARSTHRRFHPGEGRLLLLFPDPALTGSAQWGAEPYRFGHARERELIAAATASKVDVGELLELAAGAAPEPLHPGVRRAAALIRADPSAATGVSEAAGGLSPAHFQRLFTAHTGTSFRRYRQWARLRKAVDGVASGRDLSRGAADAGFGTPSQFAETFRRQFGLTASALLGTGVALDLR